MDCHLKLAPPGCAGWSVAVILTGINRIKKRIGIKKESVFGRLKNGFFQIFIPLSLDEIAVWLFIVGDEGKHACAAKKRPTPATILLLRSTRIGTTKPNAAMLRAICLICLVEWYLRFLESGPSRLNDT